MIAVIGSFYDQCTAKDGIWYNRDNGELGCYYFYSHAYSKKYNYAKSKEFCAGIEGAKGSLPIVEGPNDNKNLLRLLNGYVSPKTYKNCNKLILSICKVHIHIYAFLFDAIRQFFLEQTTRSLLITPDFSGLTVQMLCNGLEITVTSHFLIIPTVIA